MIDYTRHTHCVAAGRVEGWHGPLKWLFDVRVWRGAESGLIRWKLYAYILDRVLGLDENIIGFF